MDSTKNRNDRIQYLLASSPKHSSMMNSLNCVEFSYHNLDFTSATTIIRWLSDLWIQRRTATIEFNICWQAPKHSSMMNSLNCVEFSYHNLDFTSATTIIRWLSDLWIQRRTATIEFNICWQAPKHSSMMNSLNCVEFSYHNLDFTSATTIIRIHGVPASEMESISDRCAERLCE